MTYIQEQLREPIRRYIKGEGGEAPLSANELAFALTHVLLTSPSVRVDLDHVLADFLTEKPVTNFRRAAEVLGILQAVRMEYRRRTTHKGGKRLVVDQIIHSRIVDFYVDIFGPFQDAQAEAHGDVF